MNFRIQDSPRPVAFVYTFLLSQQFLKKLNRQERVVEEVKLVLKPHYTKKHVTKEEYKDIMRKAVPKVSIVKISLSIDKSKDQNEPAKFFVFFFFFTDMSQ